MTDQNDQYVPTPTPEPENEYILRNDYESYSAAVRDIAGELSYVGDGDSLSALRSYAEDAVDKLEDLSIEQRDAADEILDEIREAKRGLTQDEAAEIGLYECRIKTLEKAIARLNSLTFEADQEVRSVAHDLEESLRTEQEGETDENEEAAD